MTTTTAAPQKQSTSPGCASVVAMLLGVGLWAAASHQWAEVLRVDVHSPLISLAMASVVIAATCLGPAVLVAWLLRRHPVVARHAAFAVWHIIAAALLVVPLAGAEGESTGGGRLLGGSAGPESSWQDMLNVMRRLLGMKVVLLKPGQRDNPGGPWIVPAAGNGPTYVVESDGRVWRTATPRRSPDPPWLAMPDDRFPAGGEWIKVSVPDPVVAVDGRFGRVLVSNAAGRMAEVTSRTVLIYNLLGMDELVADLVHINGEVAAVDVGGHLWIQVFRESDPKSVTRVVEQVPSFRHVARILRLDGGEIALLKEDGRITGLPIHGQPPAPPWWHVDPEAVGGDVKALQRWSGGVAALDRRGRLWLARRDASPNGLGPLQKVIRAYDTPLPRRFTALECEGTCIALEATGTVWAWGPNDAGQCGEGSLSDVIADPVMVLGEDGWPIAGIRAVATAADRAYALGEDGRLLTWGRFPFAPEPPPAPLSPGSRRYARVSYRVPADPDATGGDGEGLLVTHVVEYVDGEDPAALASALAPGWNPAVEAVLDAPRNSASDGLVPVNSALGRRIRGRAVLAPARDPRPDDFRTPVLPDDERAARRLHTMRRLRVPVVLD